MKTVKIEGVVFVKKTNVYKGVLGFDIIAVIVISLLVAAFIFYILYETGQLQHWAEQIHGSLSP